MSLGVMSMSESERVRVRVRVGVVSDLDVAKPV